MEFEKIKLKDFATITMGQSPKSEFYNNEGNGLPFLQGVRTFGEIYPTIDTYTIKGNKIAEKGDILFTVRAPVGDINIAPEKLCIGRGLAAIKSEDQEFLYYLLKNNKQMYQNYSTGTIYNSINKTELENLEFKIPDYLTRKRISKILRDIDKKVKTNNKIIENLESQAQAIFKSWFVDFEPFQDGNFVESELGLIPEGWEVVRFGDLFKFQKGKKPKNFLDYNVEESIPYIVKGVIDGSERPSYTLDEKIIKIEDMDIFMLMDGANAGNIYYGYNGALGSTFSFLNIDDLEYREFIYWFLRTNEDYIRNQNTGSAIPHANKDFINNIRFALPKNISKLSILNYFKVIRTKVITLKQENQTLAQTRDTLLPKLMRGEIDVSNIKIDDEDIDYE